MEHVCYQCNVPFTPDRQDAIFCSDVCKAAHYREHGQTGKHAHLEQLASLFCEFCGRTFWYNAYADRGGKRTPKYCCDNCRVKAYRARKANEAKAQQRAQSEPKSWEAFREKAKQKEWTGDFRDHLKEPTRYGQDDWYRWLGVPVGSDEKTCKSAFRKLNAEHHPDKNGGAQWAHMGAVNAAWDFLKRRVFKS